MERELTGRHVAAIFVTGFGIIIAVNVTLAVLATGTFPGLETKNSYVASQSFEADRAAQEALGWEATARLASGQLTLTFRDGAGQPVRPESFTATLGRATHVGDDLSPDFRWTGAAFVAAAPEAAGRWQLRIDAEAANGTRWRRRLDIAGPAR